MEQISQKDTFIVKKTDNCKFPVYLESQVENLWARAKIDVAGWASFKRLVLLQD